MSYTKFFATAILSLFLAACGGNKTIEDPDPTGSTYGGNDASTTGGGSDELYGGGTDVPYDESLGSVIYFDYDSSAVRAEDQDLVAAHAIQLNADSYVSVRLQGHADERGSREYNIGLGERRAQAVRQMLMIQGVSASQIQTVSFGEERPQSMGSSESDYAQNRRVEINYPDR